MKIVTIAVAASVVLAGCAKNPEDVIAQYRSPASYQHLSCNELSGELERIGASVAKVADAQDDARTRDQIAMGVGLVLFWPALFFLATGDEEEQLSRLKGEYEAMKTVYAQKKCAATPARTFAADYDPAAGAHVASSYAPLPAGTPSPYEGVRLSSFSAPDMRWFCGQSWGRRVAPTGRTEYNPCHVPEMFVE